MNIEGLKSTDGIDVPQDGLVHPQFPAFEATVDVLSVYDSHDIECNELDFDDTQLQANLRTEEVMISQSENHGDTGSEDAKENGEDVYEDFLLPDDISDYGSGCIVIAINYRLVVLQCEPR